MQYGQDAMQNDITENEFNTYLDLIGEGRTALEKWERELQDKIGGLDDVSLIVFNANPFTFGHRYLVEIAAKRSKNVLVLVIQGRPESGGKGNHETSGISFDFKDRLSMTQRCLSDMANVTVLPSGPYVISRDDYPGTFLSERLGKVPAHAVLDSKVICHICTALGIKKVFAGDEPRDEMSEIHLNALRTECASHQIVLKVAERKRLGEKYISSSMVRQDMADGRTDEIRLIVPEAVLEYL
ncbi:MAG: hypothetical protein IJM52_10695 [Spirochaetales bacterium]|nr:hypothetical protein [Spirochaetales bacterium]MBQ9811616.1 hypothetical protein [Spirochaetales bacterium]MBR4477779.1 hypothetical protein [Spirochaetales bacterium]MBR6234863.1 hypothetical protein [Spirochaetales bacterium]